MNEVELLKKLLDYVQLVRDARKAQKDYFRNRTTNALVLSKGLEAKLDSQNPEILQAIKDLLYVATEIQKGKY